MSNPTFPGSSTLDARAHEAGGEDGAGGDRGAHDRELGAQDEHDRDEHGFARDESILLGPDEDGTIVALDETTSLRIGWKRELLVDQPVATLFPPEWHAQAAALLARCRTGQAIRYAESVRWTQEGIRVPTLLSLDPLPGVDREPSGVSLFVRDVHESRPRDVLLRQIEKSLPIVLWAQEIANRRIVYVSERYETIWGRSRAELGERSSDWLRPVVAEDRPRVEAALDRLLDRGEPFDECYRIDHPDGRHRWIHDRGVLSAGAVGDAPRAVGAALDITEQVELRERLQAATVATERAEANERKKLAGDLHDSVGQLLPLVVMKLDGLFEGHGNASAPFAESLAEIRALLIDAERMARSLTFQLSPVVLSELGFPQAVERMAELLHRQYGIEIDVRAEGAIGSVDDDRGRLLLRGLRELLINVAKHAEADAAQVRIERVGDTLQVSVEDGGVGFAPGQDDSVEGFGLVALRDRLERLGGSLEIDSEPGRGCRVRMSLPEASGAGWRKSVLNDPRRPL